MPAVGVGEDQHEAAGINGAYNLYIITFERPGLLTVVIIALRLVSLVGGASLLYGCFSMSTTALWVGLASAVIAEAEIRLRSQFTETVFNIYQWLIFALFTLIAAIFAPTWTRSAAIGFGISFGGLLFLDGCIGLRNVFKVMSTPLTSIEKFDLENPDVKDPNRYYKTGLKCMNFGRIDLAIEQFQIALELDPNHAGAKVALGDALRSKK